MPKKVRTEKRQSRTHMAMPSLPTTKPMGSDPPQQRVPHPKLAVLISVLVILYVALNIWIYLYGRDAFSGILGNLLETVSIVKTQRFSLNPRATPSLTPTPTPTPKPIPHGKIDFSIGFGDKSIPQLGAGSIDPYDPQKGSTQTVTVHVKHSQPITKVTAVLKTDNLVSQPVAFRLVSGTVTDGDWQGSWQVNDTYLYTYNLLLHAESANSQSKFEFTLR